MTLRRTLLSAILCGALLVACRAERRILIDTVPQGAQVRLDDEIVGDTPLNIRFDHYGHRRLTLYRRGFRTHSEVLEIASPWYSYFPLDLVTEVLLPFGWKDIHRVEVVLMPETGNVSPPDLEAVLLRAESLRRAGPSGPVPVPPQGPPALPEPSPPPGSGKR